MDYKEKVIALLDSKELSQEQKEKLESVFPELKESEDERIRKDMLEYCHKRMKNEFPSIKIPQVKRWLAWLEKQGEQKPAWSEEDENRFRNLIYLVEHSDEGKATKEGFIKFINKIKSLKDRYT